MEHPLAVDTKVVARYEHCKTCGPGGFTDQHSRILKVLPQHADGSYTYVMLDGRKIHQSGIIEVR